MQALIWQQGQRALHAGRDAQSPKSLTRREGQRACQGMLPRSWSDGPARLRLGASGRAQLPASAHNNDPIQLVDMQLEKVQAAAQRLPPERGFIQ